MKTTQRKQNEVVRKNGVPFNPEKTDVTVARMSNYQEEKERENASVRSMPVYQHYQPIRFRHNQ